MNKKISIPIISILVLVMFVTVGFKVFGTKDNVQEEIKTLMVENMDLESNIYTNGTVVTDEATKINYDGTGVVEKIFVKKGDEIKAGQVLAKLRSDQLENNIKLKEIQVETEKSKLDQMIKEGDKSLVIALGNAKLQFEEAKRNYDSNKVLYEAGALNKIEFEKLKTAFDQAKNNLEEAQFKLKNSNTASNIYMQRKTIESGILELNQLKKDLEKTTIKSSIDGTVTELKIKSGMAFERENYMFYIQNFKKNEIVANISEADINKVKVGQKVNIKGNSIKGKTLFGKVSKIAPGTKKVQGKKQAYVEIRITLDKYDPDLRTGFSVNLVLNTAKKENVKAVKFEAISSDLEGNKFVNILKDDGSTEKIPVEIGIEGDVYVEIISDEIKIGDNLLMNEDYGNVENSEEEMGLF